MSALVGGGRNGDWSCGEAVIEQWNFSVSSTCSLHHVKRPGAILHPGTLVARLDLDDPTRVKQAARHQGTFSENRGHALKIQGDKVHQVIVRVRV